MARSSGKVGMRRWREGQRKSPRLSALDGGTGTGTSKSLLSNPPPPPHPPQQSRRVGLQPHRSKPQAKGPASRTRSTTKSKRRRRRKLRPLVNVNVNVPPPSPSSSSSPPPQQGSDQQTDDDEDHPTSSDQQTAHGGNSTKSDDKAASPDQLSSVASTKWIPEKRVLEHILDILQRRDTYEIFAEPVDPEEVEDYYEIIKEPMDFGTMRAKLHEGMYTSLAQFEHDVYLISRNAMHFNSSATIFFRQARAIDELAKKVFHALKTDPENFELEFSETRRRTSRRLVSEAKAPSYSSSSKRATNSRPNGKTTISSKTMPCSPRNSSNLRKSVRGIRGHSSATTDLNARDHEMHAGAINGRRDSLAEEDRRSSYRPWISLHTENDSIVSTVYSESKLLNPVNQQDISYRDSLMLFVKDLGPTVQMVAKRKLIGSSVDPSSCWTPGSNHWFQEHKCQNPNAVRSTISRNANYKVDSSYAGIGWEAYATHRMLNPNAWVEVASSSDEKKIPVAFNNAMGVPSIFSRDRLHTDQCSEIKLGSHASGVGARDLNHSVAEMNNLAKSSTPMIMVKSNSCSQEQQLESSLAESQANMSHFGLRNNYRVSPSWPQQNMGSSVCSGMKVPRHNAQPHVPRNIGQDITAQDKAGQELKVNQPMQPASGFVFDLPFLKRRLDQIDSLEKDKTLQQGCSSTEDPFLDKVSWKRQSACSSHHKELNTQTNKDSYKQFAFDAQLGDLALQL